MRKFQRKMAGFAVAAALAASMVPATAFAADISNNIWSEPNPTYLGNAAVIKQGSEYQSWGGYIPFVSNWRTELAGFTWTDPVNTYTNGNIGHWYSTETDGQWFSGWCWVSSGSEEWFAGNTIWWCWSSTSAKERHTNRRIVHGQSDWINSSVGSTTTFYTTCY